MAFFLVHAIFAAVASALSVSRQIQLGNHEYFVPPTASWKLESWDYNTGTDEFVPLTVVHLNDTVDAASVASALVEYEKDDVWTTSFAEGKLQHHLSIHANSHSHLCQVHKHDKRLGQGFTP
jgi:hypothetical protein